MTNNKFIIRTNSRNQYILGMIGVVILSSIFAYFLSDKSMPIAEGWYDYYATQILDGQLVYKDFEYLFTPIYIYFIAFFVKLFGTSVIHMRILGVFMFVLIAVLLYFIMSKLFSISAALFGSVTAVLFLQSEVYTVFYDYVRLMDIFIYLSVLFMICTIKKWITNKEAIIELVLWGIFSSLFILVKQNMGILYAVYSIMFLSACLIYQKSTLKNFLKNFFIYFLSLTIPILMTLIIIASTSDLNVFLNAVLFGAAEAKGGIWSILFRWIITGKDWFSLYLLEAIVAIIILMINYRWSRLLNYDKKINDSWIPICGFIMFGAGIVSILTSRRLGEYFSTIPAVNEYLIFLITFLCMLLLITVFIIDLIKKQTRYSKYLPLLGCLGAFFAISYGAGTSGGLSVGESALGVSLVVGLFYDSLKNHLGIILKTVTVCFCIYISLRNIGVKLIHPCQWWGIDTSSIYDCNVKTDIPALKGILVSESEKSFYENTVNMIKKYSTKDDAIYCFPCIPIVYCLSEREDPGVFSKVQWFDVSTNESVINDIEIIKKAKPKVIVIYNLNEATYDGHESAFNAGHTSGTRYMRDFLYEYVYTNGYQYIGNYSSDNNNVSIFALTEATFTDTLNGSGTIDDPYLIKTTQDLINWSIEMNGSKANHDNIYYQLDADIDLSETIWIPAGYYQNHNTPILDMNNHVILNINQNPERYNLGEDIITNE